jgi:imidazolonepropionase-like amidohydrolase
VDSIEHGHRADREALELIKAKGVFLVPTVGVVDARLQQRKTGQLTPEQQKSFDALLESTEQEVRQAMALGIKIASGFDAGNADRQGRNAEELVALNRRGMPPLEAIRAATINAAELLGWQDRVGAVEAGKYADLIAVEGDPLADISVLRQVKFVMKAGTIVKDELPH